MKPASRLDLGLTGMIGVLAVTAFVALIPEASRRLFGPSPGIPHKQAQAKPIFASRTEVDLDTTEVIDDAEIPLTDDSPNDKNPTFDPAYIDRRPFEGYQLNTSGAVVRLDPPRLFDDNAGKRSLAASYADLMSQPGPDKLASVNLIDGKAKQFDDGLYAAIDRAYYSGDPALGAGVEGHLALLGRLLAKLPAGSAAANYLAAGLSLDSTHPAPADLSLTARKLADSFRRDEILSKPISFYTWDATLGDCFRVLRFCNQPIKDGSIVTDLARVLRDDPDLLKRYEQASGFYGRLTNPLATRSLADFAHDPTFVFDRGAEVSLFPPSTSREGELFRKLFPNGPPPNTQMMRALVEAIRAGTVELAPNEHSGWYEYQAYALEPLLLPDRGAGADHLLLTKNYKRRMLVAFEALLTKRRETHARQFPVAVMSRAAHPVATSLPPVYPRLRVEPNPSYYLRTARSYAFVADLLEVTFGSKALETLHARRAEGPRPLNLGDEVRSIRDLFLGFACLSSEDIGHRLDLTAAEGDRRATAEALATAWLKQVAADPASDPDLAADTRVAIPIGFNPKTNKVRLWATIGVTLTPLNVQYDQPPQIRPAEGGDWRTVRSADTKAVTQFIAVDEFAEIELDGGRILNRDELRAICDAHKTRDAIRQALGALK